MIINNSVYFLHIITHALSGQAFLNESRCLRSGLQVSVFVFCSLYRSNDLQEVEIKFLQLKEKVPVLVGISQEVSILSDKCTDD